MSENAKTATAAMFQVLEADIYDLKQACMSPHTISLLGDEFTDATIRYKKVKKTLKLCVEIAKTF